MASVSAAARQVAAALPEAGRRRMKNLVNRCFSDNDFEAIKNVVAEAESRTSGEIVIRVCTQSHQWFAERMLVACFLSLLAIAVSLTVTRQANWGTYYDFSQATLWGIVGFLVGYVGVAPLVRTRSRRQGFVWQHALEIFSKLPSTKGGTGVLILVSLTEAEAAIVADKGIAEKLPDHYWDHPHALLVASIKDDRHSEGLIAAVREIGSKLAEHFPRLHDDTNELSDRPEVI